MNDHSNLYPYVFIRMLYVHGVKFLGNEFRNSVGYHQNTSSVEQGSGIEAINATFSLKGICLNNLPNGDCSSYDYNEFQFLHYGIRAYATGPLPLNGTLEIENNIFTSNWRSILIDGFDAINPQMVLRNFIANGHNANNPIQGPNGITNASIWINGSSGFKIEENYMFGGTQGLNMYAWNTSDEANEIYKNYFDGFPLVGSANAENNLGLLWKCNQYLRPMADIAVFSGGIRHFQGYCPLGDPAGNEFSPTCTQGVLTESHLFTNPNTVPFEYHHYSDQGPDPDCVNDFTPIHIEDCGEFSNENSCPSKIGVNGGGGYAERRSSNEEQADSIEAQYVLLDDENTTGLIALLNNSAVADSIIVDTLLDVGPWLSDDVLLALMYRENSIDTADLGHILINNAPHTPFIMRAVDSLNPPLPADTLTRLLQHQDSTSARKDVIDKIYYHKYSRELNYTQMLYLTYIDSNYTVDSVAALLDTETDINLRIKRADLHFAEGEYDEALAIYNDVPVYNEEVEQLVKLRKVGMDIFNEEDDYFDLVSETYSGTKGVIEAIAATDTRAALQAQNILLMVFGEETPEEGKWFEEGGGSKRSFDTQNEKPANSVARNEVLSVYPNPANEQVIIEYDIEENQDDVKFYLFNLLGNQIMEARLDPSLNKAVFKLESIFNGVYIYKVTSNMTNFSTGKISILR